jgi:hypothetical protein
MPHLLSGKRGSKSSQSRPFRSSQEDLPVAMWSGSHLSGGPEHGSFDVHSPCGVGAFILLGAEAHRRLDRADVASQVPDFHRMAFNKLTREP